MARVRWATLGRLLGYLVAGVVLLGLGLRAVVWWGPDLSEPAQRWLAPYLPVAVEVETLVPVWDSLWPGLEARGVEVADGSTRLSAQSVRLQPAPGASLRAQRPVLQRVAIREADLHLDAAGLLRQARADGPPGAEPLQVLPRGPAIDWVEGLPRNLSVEGLRLHLQPREGAAERTAALRVIGERRGRTVRLAVGGAEDSQRPGAGFAADAEWSAERPAALTWRLALADEPIAPWSALLHGRPATGTLDGGVAGRIERGRLQALEGRLHGHDLGTSARRPFPALAGWEASAAFAGQSVRLEVGAQGTAIDLPWLFGAPLPLERAEAQAVGRWSPEGHFQLATERLRVANADLTASGDFRLQYTGEAPELFLRATAEGARAERVPDYVPAGVTPVEVQQWLRRALERGAIPRADLLLAGDPRDFPFDGGEGVFDVRAAVTDGRLQFDPEWPRITDIDAQLRFHNARMTIEGRGRTNGAQLQDVRVAIADLREPVLEVSGRAAADAGQGLAYLAASPMGREWIGDPVALHGRGPMTVDLDFHLPLEHAHGETLLLNGRVDLAGVTAGIAPWFEAEDLRGALRFDAAGLESVGPIHGRWGGEPARIRVDRQERDGWPELRLRAEAFGSPGTLLAFLDDDPAWIQGAAPWQVEARLPAFQPRPRPLAVDLSVRSSLAGLGLDMPQPIGLAAPAQRPLRIDVGFTDRGLESYWLRYGDILRAGAAADEQGRPATMSVVLGDAAPRLPERGVRLHGTLERLDLSAWQHWLRRHQPWQLGNGATAGDWALPRPLAAHLRIADLHWAGRRYGAQTAAAELQEDGTGRIGLRGDLVEGTVRRGEAAGPVTVSLRHLDLPAVVGREPERTPEPIEALAERPARPEAWPVLRAHVGQLRIDARTVGSVRIAGEPRDGVYYVDQAQLRGTAVEASLSGEWDSSGTRIGGRLRADDVADLQSLLGAPRAVILADVDLVGDLSWSGPPWAFALERMEGGLALNMRDGRITTVEPGAGRLVGLLGLRMLPRRILLDFGDFFGEGFAFDTLEARMVAGDGRAHVETFAIVGPAARVTIEGSMDLAARMYDNRISVEPRVGATLPWIGAILGGGVGAVGGALADQLLGEGFDRAAAVHYRLRGAWTEPEVFRLGVEDGTEQ